MKKKIFILLSLGIGIIGLISFGIYSLNKDAISKTIVVEESAINGPNILESGEYKQLVMDLNKEGIIIENQSEEFILKKPNILNILGFNKRYILKIRIGLIKMPGISGDNYNITKNKLIQVGGMLSKLIQKQELAYRDGFELKLIVDKHIRSMKDTMDSVDSISKAIIQLSNNHKGLINEIK